MMENIYNSDDGWHEYMHQRPEPKQFVKNIGCIGVIGYSAQEYDKSKGAEYLLFSMFDMEHLLTYELGCNRFKLVSGLTNLGIPKEAYSLANILGDDVIAVGFACSKAKDYPQFPVDEKHIIGTEWGDESEAFLSDLDGLIRIGGGEQSHEEAKKFKEMYPEKPIIEFDL